MSDPLATYLHDHLAGSSFAMDLLETLRDQHAEEPIGKFAEELLVEIKAERKTLQAIADRAGAGRSGLKEVTALMTEKISRLKLGRSVAGDFGTFEALELLSLGIFGRLQLWRALAVLSAEDARLSGVDYGRLASRAEEQLGRVEEHRLEVARHALVPAHK